MNIKIRAIISDLDGVIRRFPAKRDEIIERKYSLPAGSILKNAFGFDDLDKVIRGEISDHIWRGNIKNRLSTFVSQQIANDAIDEWTNYSGEINEEVLEVYRILRKTKPLFLMTNATDKLDYDLKQLKLIDEFDQIINSSTLGFAKPDSEIFEHALNKLNLLPSEVAFVDDSLNIIRKAQDMGFICHHYQDFDLFREFFGCENASND